MAASNEGGWGRPREDPHRRTSSGAERLDSCSTHRSRQQQQRTHERRNLVISILDVRLSAQESRKALGQSDQIRSVSQSRGGNLAGSGDAEAYSAASRASGF